MNKSFKIFFCFLTALLLVGMTANAGRNGSRAGSNSLAPVSADNDTVAADTAAAPLEATSESAVAIEAIFIISCFFIEKLLSVVSF